MHKRNERTVSLPVAVVITALAFLAGIGLGRFHFVERVQTDAGTPVTGNILATTNTAQLPADTYGFSGVIIGLGSDRLVVYVSQGIDAGTNMTVFIDSDTVLQKIIPKTDQELAAETNYAAKIKHWDSSKGLPPPLDPVEDLYKTAPIKVSDLVVDDVADFTAVGDPTSGQMTAKSISWTWHLDRNQPILNQ